MQLNFFEIVDVIEKIICLLTLQLIDAINAWK
jgi:hypothetical protein